MQTPNELGIMKEYSNRSFEIGGQGWTREQTQRAFDGLEAYRARQRCNRQVYIDRRQFERYRQRLGDKAPQSFSAFRRIKAANGARWERLQSEYRSSGRAIRQEELNKRNNTWVSTTQKEVNRIIKEYLPNVKFTKQPYVTNSNIYSGRTTIIRDLGNGKVIRVKNILIGKQADGKDLTLVNTLLHEELEARIAIGNGLKYTKLNSTTEEERHLYIDSVINRFFKMKGWQNGK